MVTSIALRGSSTLAMLLLFLSLVQPASASGPERQGAVWEPPAPRSPSYRIGAPVIERIGTEAGEIAVTVYRPEATEGGSEPGRVPVVLVSSWYSAAYAATGLNPQHSFPIETSPHAAFRDWFVPRGYALAVADAYGTNSSDGCHDYFGPKEVAAISDVIVALANAPWSNGRVGMIGGSYDGGSAIHAAARGSDAAREALVAVVTSEAPTNHYETSVGVDGVPYSGSATSVEATSYAFGTIQNPLDPQGPSRYECRMASTQEAINGEQTGDFTPYWRARDARPQAPSVRAAILMVQGLRDQTVYPTHLPGFFDRLPKSTPRMLVLGQWGHANPTSPGEDGGGRGDLFDVWLGWFDHYLMGLNNGADDWPVAQVEDSEGLWRFDSSWPESIGRVGQLALSGNGTLGSSDPAGSSSFSETAGSELAREAVFTSPQLSAPLRLSGRPVVDLWLELSEPDAHIGVELRVIDASGSPIAGTDFYGLRSARHLDPMKNGSFEQGHGRPAPVAQPIRMPIALSPLELVVPEGGRLQLTVRGWGAHPGAPSSPSGAPVVVTVLHDCEHPSVLRFRMPREGFDAVNVRDVELASEPLVNAPVSVDSVDGAGIAGARVCSRKGIDPGHVLSGRETGGPREQSPRS